MTDSDKIAAIRAAGKHGYAWCNGSDPEDGGWSFTEAGCVDGYQMAYETPDREAALDLCVPEDILNMFEKDRGPTGYENGGLMTWLQDHPDLFFTDTDPLYKLVNGV